MTIIGQYLRFDIHFDLTSSLFQRVVQNTYFLSSIPLEYFTSVLFKTFPSQSYYLESVYFHLVPAYCKRLYIIQGEMLFIFSQIFMGNMLEGIAMTKDGEGYCVRSTGESKRNSLIRSYTLNMFSIF